LKINNQIVYSVCLLLALLSPGRSVSDTAASKPRVVIDAAHGGTDPGSKAGSEIEKDWNLRIAQALQKAFEAAGFEVMMTRSGDDTVEAVKRTDLINTSRALAVIVIHADRDWTGTQNGPILVVEPPNQTVVQDTEVIQRLGAVTPAQYRSSLRLARTIAQKLEINGGFAGLSDSRGTTGEALSANGRIFCLPHQSLRYLIKPAVVLTPLFLTSSSDVKKFNQPDHLTAFVTKVVQGTTDYLQISGPKPTAVAPTPIPTPTAVPAK
jgi:N-acetylmuramoyl-L-alanine amidase